MDETTVNELLATLIRQGEEHSELLRSIDNRLIDVIEGIATVADTTAG